MMSACLVPLLAIVASAQQYGIQDVLGNGGATQQQPVAQVQTGPTGAVQQAPSGYATQTPGYGAQTPGQAAVQAANSQSIGYNPNPVSYNPAPSAHEGNSFQPQGGMNGGNPMQSLLNNIAGPMEAASQVQPQGGAINGAVLSQASLAVVSGLVEAFMHKVQLLPGEKSCLQHNVAQLTGDVMGTIGDVAIAIKALVEGHGSIQKHDTGSIVGAGMDSAMKITSLVAETTQLIKNCVHGDALLLMNRTAHHLINATYLGDRFLANGVDIAHELSKSIVHFEHHHYRHFGHDIGKALRKILLSNATNGTALPEGVPEQDIQQATSGLMKGFFVSGSEVIITDTAEPDVHIDINLHQCIAGNSAFFKELWLAAWDLIAKLSANGAQHDFAQMFQPHQAGQGGGQPKWAGELMIAMMQFPMAISRCGVDANSQNMLMEAIKTLGNLHVEFQFPDDRVQTTDETEKMAKAVQAWTEGNYEMFGYELGKLFRELVIIAFPQLYSVDESGRLQRYSKIQAEGSGSVSSFLIIGGAAVSLLAAFAVVRTRRSLPQVEPYILSDVEDGILAVE